jgi:hypothetical protein
MIESLALVRHGIKWVMWEDRPSVGTAAGGPKRVLSITGVGQIMSDLRLADSQGKTSAEIYRSIYGNALTEVCPAYAGTRIDETASSEHTSLFGREAYRRFHKSTWCRQPGKSPSELLRTRH